MPILPVLKCIDILSKLIEWLIFISIDSDQNSWNSKCTVRIFDTACIYTHINKAPHKLKYLLFIIDGC